MMSWIDDLAGAIRDVFGWIIWGFSYFLAGTLIVAAPLYLLVWLFGWFA